jgi:rRNA maturation RNase YbeY
MQIRVLLAEEAFRSRLDLAHLRRIGRRAAREQGLRRGAVNVVLTGDEDLRRLNRAHRGIDAPTDVLSFSLGERLSEDDVLGEVYISLPYARRRASQQRRALRREVLHLMVHGLLHLAGYDHQTDAAWQDMERETRRYTREG